MTETGAGQRGASTSAMGDRTDAVRELAPRLIGATLIAIDVQHGFDLEPSGPRNNTEMEANGLRVLSAWRQRGWPIVHVRHDSVMPLSPLRPGQTGNCFKKGFEPVGEEILVTKTVNSAFIGTDLEALLRSRAARRVVMFGISTDMCVSTSARSAANLGFDVTVIGDACHTWGQMSPDGRWLTADEIHIAHLTTLHSEFATVLTTDAVCKAVDNPQVDPLSPDPTA